ncbi:unnamed protein product [Caenorhabditis angaria]|uniref:MKRN2 opposite strand protein-like C-terminal domain-containing protein n=1 Tax=Caenorhabditis angaria TaxID=860376 RepID=A0A9P1IC83_9PELO|nr:unnamed protein product [Caenorhabditis angaria]
MSPATEEFVCPDCNRKYEEASWTNNPLPCPFIEQVNARCAIVIKPSSGFFTSYQIGDDLHIGICDSNSVIHSYWTDGIVAQDTSWDKSILVYDFLPDFSNNTQWFDSTLVNFIQHSAGRFQIDSYNEFEWNCFDFVMEFLKFINFRNYTKVHFVSEFLQETLRNSMKYCSLVSKMAEFLEDLESTDADRSMDAASFQNQQFEIFQHDYRENAETDCKDDDGNHTNCKHADDESRKSKKELINVTRRLQKAMVAMEMMAGKEVISDLSIAITDINNQLRNAILKDNAEFSTTSVSLPDYDTTDMQLLMGTDEVSPTKPMLERIREEQQKSKLELNLIVAQANILLQEYDHIRNGLPTRN